MILNGSYIGRTGKFNYVTFATDALVALNGESTNKTCLFRAAVEHGADDKHENIIKKLSEALNTIGNRTGFRRHKIKGEKGFYFKHEKAISK